MSRLPSAAAIALSSAPEPHGARSGSLRDDVAPVELASYCLHALGAAGSMPSRAAVHRLVAITLAGVVAQS